MTHDAHHQDAPEGFDEAEEAARAEGAPVAVPVDVGAWDGFPIGAESDDDPGQAEGAPGDVGPAGDGGPARQAHRRVLRRRRPRPMRLETFEVPGAVVAVGFDPDTGLSCARVLATPPEVGARGLRRAVKALARSRALRALAGVAVDVVEAVPYAGTAVQALRLATRAVRAAREAVEDDDVEEAAAFVDDASALDDATARAVLRESVRRRVPPEALAHVARELAREGAP